MEKPVRLKLDDQWHTRDLPVLATAARFGGRDIDLTIGDLVRIELDLSEEEVLDAFRALDDAGYLEAVIGGATLGSSGGVFAVHLRERGRRALGIWPSEEGVDALIEALEQAADATADPEEKTLLRRAGGQIGMVSRDIMVDVVAAVVARQSGLG